jgi:hypothetical protein
VEAKKVSDAAARGANCCVSTDETKYKTKGDWKMDKDMMDKVNEAMKANGMRELSLDEMDKVAGGLHTDDMTAADKMEFNNTFMAITQAFGFDVAHQMFMEATGYQTYYKQGHGHSVTDEEKMKLVLDEFWNFTDNYTGGHH